MYFVFRIKFILKEIKNEKKFYLYLLIHLFIVYIQLSIHNYFLFFLKFIYFYFTYFWLHWVFIAAHGLSQVAGSGGPLFVVVCGLLIAVASLVVEHGL